MNSICYELNIDRIHDKEKHYEEQMPEAVAGSVLKYVAKFIGNY